MNLFRKNTLFLNLPLLVSCFGCGDPLSMGALFDNHGRAVVRSASMDREYAQCVGDGERFDQEKIGDDDAVIRVSYARGLEENGPEKTRVSLTFEAYDKEMGFDSIKKRETVTYHVDYALEIEAELELHRSKAFVVSRRQMESFVRGSASHVQMPMVQISVVPVDGVQRENDFLTACIWRQNASDLSMAWRAFVTGQERYLDFTYHGSILPECELSISSPPGNR